MDLSKVTLITDIDGTLLTTQKQIHPKDMEAIERLRKSGGRFTVATGRGYSMAAPVIEKIKLDMPAVIFNGAAVYDFQKDEFLWTSRVFGGSADYIKLLMSRFPDVAIEVLRQKEVYVPAINDVERRHLAYENVTPIRCTVDEIPRGDWLKVLIAYEPEKMEALVEFAQENCKENVNWVRSEPHYYEMLPVGVSKAYGFERLLEATGLEKTFTVAMGDFMNDYEMIKAADLGVAVGSAIDEVKKAADLVVCDNDSGALSEVVSYLEKL